MEAVEGLDKFMQERQRLGLIEHFRDIDDHTREERVDRYLEVKRPFVAPIHHFTHASTECMNLYRDGHFIATVMTTQAVNEGILKLVAERKNIEYENLSELLQTLALQNIFSQSCFEASDQIQRSYRNDVHHMNPPVGQIDFPALAKKNIQNLAIVESEVFYVDVFDGKVILKHPEFWNV
ncbi:MAG: hypothetical protein OXM61_07245 [Candidatus Poribacteria bacterium]|nr:hypothetical protein [Candidatus Poribacteria bacterium]